MPALLLRPWQQRALVALAAHPEPDFLAVATPGAGKTTFALAALSRTLGERPGAAVVVVPTAHLKLQWAAAAAPLGLHLDPAWQSGTPFKPDMHGVVVTYQQVAVGATDLARRTAGGVVVLDEVHHAGDERAWGDATAVAFAPARLRLMLSGTPFRSDTQAIPFVRYRADEAQPDIEYGYGAALADGVVRPVYFPRVDGEMEWVSADGAYHAARFGDELDLTLTAQRLRTALSVEGDWLPAVLRQAHHALLRIRCDDPRAAALAITADTEHARGVARLLRDRVGVDAVVATSDDADASERIAAFAESDAPWIVAVRMVSEGVDIPRLRIGVYATTTATELFFRQAVGRLVRVTAETRGQRSIMFLPDDPRLRAHAFGIAEARRHLLRRREEDVAAARSEDPLATLQTESEQMSLFQAVAATAVDSAAEPEWFAADPFPGAAAAAAGVPLQLTPPPTLAGMLPVDPDAAADTVVAPARYVTRAQLRAQNADVARVLARRSGLDHRAVNAELNRLAGIARIGEATLEQLRARIVAGERWLARV